MILEFSHFLLLYLPFHFWYHLHGYCLSVYWLVCLRVCPFVDFLKEIALCSSDSCIVFFFFISLISSQILIISCFLLPILLLLFLLSFFIELLGAILNCWYENFPISLWKYLVLFILLLSLFLLCPINSAILYLHFNWIVESL